MATVAAGTVLGKVVVVMITIIITIIIVHTVMAGIFTHRAMERGAVGPRMTMGKACVTSKAMWVVERRVPPIPCAGLDVVVWRMKCTRGL